MVKAGFLFCLISTAILGFASGSFPADEKQLPPFARDTVLVWQAQNEDYKSDFVIRIAEFLPNRFLEWEDGETQGTLFMSSLDIQEAKGYSTHEQFKSGIDARTQNTTTMWLSRKIYRELKDKKKIKIDLDGVPGFITLIGTDQMSLEVNKSKITLPVIKVRDDRGSERWFLDQEDNPLLVRHLIRKYDQHLVSITTDRPNTLRFIRGSKLRKN
jgi:hypothetical protein